MATQQADEQDQVMTSLSALRPDIHILPEGFDEPSEDGGGLAHLFCQISTRGYLTIEDNWADSNGSGDTSDCNRLIGSYSGVKWHPVYSSSSDRLHYRPLRGEQLRDEERKKKRDEEWLARHRQAERQQSAEQQLIQAAREQTRQAAQAAAEEARQAERVYPGFAQDKVACKQALYGLISHNLITYEEFSSWLRQVEIKPLTETIPAIWQRWEKMTGGVRPSRRN